MGDDDQTPVGTTRGAIEESRKSDDQRTHEAAKDPNWTGATKRPEGVEPGHGSDSEAESVGSEQPRPPPDQHKSS
jgi:hypothetical protein